MEPQGRRTVDRRTMPGEQFGEADGRRCQASFGKAHRAHPQPDDPAGSGMGGRAGRGGAAGQKELRRRVIPVDRPADQVPDDGFALPFVHQHGPRRPVEPAGIGEQQLSGDRVVHGEHGACPALRGRGLADALRAFQTDRRKSGEQLVELPVNDAGSVGRHRTTLPFSRRPTLPFSAPPRLPFSALGRLRRWGVTASPRIRAVSAQGELPLRPMTLGELLDAAMALLRRRALLLFCASAVLATGEQLVLAPLRSRGLSVPALLRAGRGPLPGLVGGDLAGVRQRDPHHHPARSAGRGRRRTGAAGPGRARSGAVAADPAARHRLPRRSRSVRSGRWARCSGSYRGCLSSGFSV